MSMLKIADLRFCETEIENGEKIRGGVSAFDSLLSYYHTSADFHLPIANSDFKLIEQSLAKDGYQKIYLHDDATGYSAFMESKKYGSAKAFSGVIKRYLPNGKNVVSFAYSAI